MRQERKIKITFVFNPLYLGLLIFMITFSLITIIDSLKGNPEQRNIIYGKASWYSTESCQREGTSGIWTASGERFDETAMTCALRSYDFGGKYKVTCIKTGVSIILRHNDFGCNEKLYKQGRIIDVTKKAFEILTDGNLEWGLIEVTVKRIE